MVVTKTQNMEIFVTTMPKKVIPLTDKQVRSAKPKDKQYSLSDGDGLSLRIDTSGSKYWIFNYYKPFTKKRATLYIGGYGHEGKLVSLTQAREQTQTYRKQVSEGIDPKAFKKSEQIQQATSEENTLEVVAAAWFEVKKTSVSSNYADDIWASLTLHIFPHLGTKPISEMTAPETIEVLRPIAAKGNFETIKRLCQRLNEIMTYAMNTGVIKHNRIYGIKAAFEQPEKRNYPTLKPAQLPELIEAINEASIKRVTRLLIMWQLHTMTRPSEAAGAMWREIDEEQGLWVIPAERMKKKREHTVPLTPQTLKILEKLKPISGHRDYLFPADRDPKKSINAQTANMALKRMGFKDLLVAHGLRALASTTLNEQGFDADLIEVALAHVDKNEIRATYNRAEYIPQRREMMEWWSDNIG